MDKNIFTDCVLCRKSLETMMKEINSCCEKFVETKIMPVSELNSWSWRFNERDTLIVIDYSYVRDSITFNKTMYCSFDEILDYIDSHEKSSMYKKTKPDFLCD